MKKHRKKQAVPTVTAKSVNYSLIGLVTLIVARPLVPEDPGGQAGFGVAFILLWLLLAIGWIAQQWRAKRALGMFDLADWLLLILVGWHSLSALIAAIQTSPRPATNMLWDWISIGLVFFLGRRILSTGVAARGVIAVMIGLALGLSLVAIEQRFVSMPNEYRAFEAARNDPAQLYALSGQWLQPDSPELGRFENRILSQQPTATFALTNSLAGFLVPWSLLLAARLVSCVLLRITSRSRFIVGGFALVAMLFTIALTSSRTAIIALGAGLAAVGIVFVARTPYRRIVLKIGALFLAFSLGGAYLAWQGGFGRDAAQSAIRSIAFRAEYWQATLAMIADNPFVGCGPGQFQDTYTLYKLPSASEEVQDPHNWLLEVTATAGTPAGIILIAILAVIAWQIARSPKVLDSTPVGEPSNHNEPLTGAVIGITLGLILAFVNGFSPSSVQFVLIAVGICLVWWSLQPWIQTGTLDSVFILIAGPALVLNLSAAGGIGYPSIADSLWLLAAIGMGTTREVALPSIVPSQEPAARATLATSRWWIPLGVVCGALFIAAYWTAFRPVLNSQTAMAQADSALLRGKPSDYAPSIVNAALADPWSSRAALQLAALRLAEYEQQPNGQRLDALNIAVESMLRLSPQKSGAWVRASEMSEAVYRKTMEPNHLQLAIERQRQAIALYPANAHLHTRLAALLSDAGKKENALQAAREAIRLDRIVQEAGHRDRELSAEERAKLLKLTAKEEAFDAEKPPAVQ